MAESEEDLKSLLMKVKEDSGKSRLKTQRACYWEGPSELPERRSSSSAPRRDSAEPRPPSREPTLVSDHRPPAIGVSSRACHLSVDVTLAQAAARLINTRGTDAWEGEPDRKHSPVPQTLSECRQSSCRRDPLMLCGHRTMSSFLTVAFKVASLWASLLFQHRLLPFAPLTESSPQTICQAHHTLSSLRPECLCPCQLLCL